MLRRMTLLAALAVALLALGAGAVFAQEEQRPQEGTIEEDGVFVEANNQIVHCVGVPCVASGNDDLVYERVGNRKKDRILLKGGDDQAHANTFKRDRDVIQRRA